MKSQVQAVVELVESVVEVVPGQAVELTDAQRKQVIDGLVSGFTKGEIQLRSAYESETKLRTYCAGLLSNWLRKSPKLNGGEQYQAKNPGSRSGSAEYKQAMQLKKFLVSQNKSIPAELEQFITTNAPQPKVKTKQIDVSSLPEELKSLVI